MKTLNLFLVFSICISLNLFAQSKNGEITLGGKFLYNSSKLEADESTNVYYKTKNSSNLSISPRLSYFLSDNLQFGLGLTYKRDKHTSKSEYEYGDLTSTFAVTPFLRLYNSLIENFGFFEELEIFYGFGTRKEDTWEYFSYGPTKVKYSYDISELAISLNPGIYYDISEHFGLELSIGGIYYSKISTKLKEPKLNNEPSIDGEAFGFQFSLESLSVGIQYYF